MLLLAAMDGGWQVVEPVEMFTSGDQTDARVYLFSLQGFHQEETCQVTIHKDAVVDQMIANEGWSVSAGDPSILL